MISLIVRLAVNAVALWIATLVITGVEIESSSTRDEVLTLLVVAAIFGVINTFVRPIVNLFSLPAYLLTLGLFIFVVNALMLWLTSWVAGQFDVPFHVDDFWPAALLGALVVSFVSWLLTILLPK